MDDRDLHMSALWSLATCAFMDVDPADEFGRDEAIEMQNLVSSRLYELDRNTPAKTWWNCPITHPAVARALRINPKQEGAAYALTPFRLWNDGERHLILAAWPAPRNLGPVDWDHLGIRDVIAWDPQTDTARLLWDDNDTLTGSFDHSATLYGSPRRFFTDWAIARAQFFVRWVQSRKGEWAHGAVERDEIPGCLAIGDIEKIAWRPHAMPQNLATIDINPGALNRALLKAARVPRAHAATERLAA